MIQINSEHELQYITSLPRALVFLWVNWAVHAQSARSNVDMFLEYYERTYPDSYLPCYQIDVSDQVGELWDAFLEWLNQEQRTEGNLLMSGVGPLLFMRDGKIVLQLNSANQLSTTELLTLASNVFNASELI